MGVLICQRWMQLVSLVSVTRVSPAFCSLQGGAESQVLMHSCTQATHKPLRGHPSGVSLPEHPPSQWHPAQLLFRACHVYRFHSLLALRIKDSVLWCSVQPCLLWILWVPHHLSGSHSAPCCEHAQHLSHLALLCPRMEITANATEGAEAKLHSCT